MPEERDEPFNLYGLDPEKAVEGLLQTQPDVGTVDHHVG